MNKISVIIFVILEGFIVKSPVIFAWFIKDSQTNQWKVWAFTDLTNFNATQNERLYIINPITLKVFLFVNFFIWVWFWGNSFSYNVQCTIIKSFTMINTNQKNCQRINNCQLQIIFMFNLNDTWFNEWYIYPK